MTCAISAAPGVVAVLPDAQNLGLHRSCCPQRAAMRTPRAIGKSVSPFRRISLQPLVAFGAADAEPSAQLALVRSRRQRQPHELLPLIHDRQLPPGHRGSPHPAQHRWTSVPHVPERCPPCPRSIHVGGEGRLPSRSEGSRGGGTTICSQFAARPPTPSLPAARAGGGRVSWHARSRLNPRTAKRNLSMSGSTQDAMRIDLRRIDLSAFAELASLAADQQSADWAARRAPRWKRRCRSGPAFDRCHFREWRFE